MSTQLCPNAKRDETFKLLNMLQKMPHFLGLNMSIDTASRTVTAVLSAEFAPLGLSVGPVSFDQSSRQAAHFARSARQYSEFCRLHEAGGFFVIRAKSNQTVILSG